MQSQKYDGRMFGIIAKRDRPTDIQIWYANFKLSESIFALSFSHNYETANDSNVIHEGEVKWLY